MFARHAWTQTWTQTEFFIQHRNNLDYMHRLGRKGNSNNRDLEYRDFTVLESAVP